MSRYLLDSHAVLWALIDSPRLSTTARAAILDPTADVYVSAVSAYELSYKAQLGKLPKLNSSFSALTKASGFDLLDLTTAQAEIAATLPSPHRDPWDRLIVAQAMEQNLRLISCDSAMEQLGVPLFW